MSEEPRDPTASDHQEERRSGGDRRKGEDRRRENRGVWNMPVLRRLVDRRQGGDRRSGKDRRQD